MSSAEASPSTIDSAEAMTARMRKRCRQLIGSAREKRTTPIAFLARGLPAQPWPTSPLKRSGKARFRRRRFVGKVRVVAGEKSETAKHCIGHQGSHKQNRHRLRGSSRIERSFVPLLT